MSWISKILLVNIYFLEEWYIHFQNRISFVIFSENVFGIGEMHSFRGLIEVSSKELNTFQWMFFFHLINKEIKNI